MAAQDNRGEHDRFHAAAAQFQAHTSLPWSALPNVPYSILVIYKFAATLIF